MIHKSFGATSKEISEREIKHADLSRKIGTEGIVLLQNINNVLPFKKESIALFGNGARLTSKGGTGSGDVYTRYEVSIEKGLIDAGFKIESIKYLDDFDQHFYDEYNKWKTTRQNVLKDISEVMDMVNAALEVPFDFPIAIPIKLEHLDHINTDTAIYVITRQAGEGHDRKPEGGDYYLSQIEENNIDILNQRFEQIIIIINTGSVIDTNVFKKYSSVKSILFVGQPGMEAGHAIADIITGSVNPSGKLAATWANEYQDYPNAHTFSHMNQNLNEEFYVEDIYVGYRYFDTYQKEVAFPFGHGLSYTQFEVNTLGHKIKDSHLIVNVEVENIGLYEGKEVVQIYISLPNSQIPHEFQRLVGFYKTISLKPNEKDNFEINIPLTDYLTVYDEITSSYQLLKGKYIVRTGQSSRNTKDVCIILVEEQITIEQCEPVCSSIDNFDKLSKQSNIEIPNTLPILKLDTNKLDMIIHNKYQEKFEPYIEKVVNNLSITELAQFVIGSGNRSETMIQIPTSTSTTGYLYDKYGIPGIHFTDGPAGIKVNPENVEQTNGELKPLDVPKGKGSFMDLLDTSVFLGHKDDGQAHYFYATAWPVATVLAQTWNKDILKELGEAIAVEMELFGITVWLAPGMNIQRNPLCGRNFEYYSEDPVLSGHIAASITQGVQSNKSLAVSLKHFVANNQEDNRRYSNSVISERALREIYLKGFEIAVKNASPKTIMTSYNKLNGIYTANHKELLEVVLRKEWNYQGLVITDWGSCEEDRGRVDKAFEAGNDLIMPGTPQNQKDLIDAIQQGNLSIDKVRQSAKRLLRLISDNQYFPFLKGK